MHQCSKNAIAYLLRVRQGKKADMTYVEDKSAAARKLGENGKWKMENSKSKPFQQQSTFIIFTIALCIIQPHINHSAAPRENNARYAHHVNDH